MSKAPRKLKVFVTSTGFHDAYVAASSRKAALAAWGSTHDLFARGVASEVTDASLTAEPLAHPGEVVKRARGTREEQIAALGDAPAKPARKTDAPGPRRKTRQSAPAKPRPSRPTAPGRTAVDAAAAALREAEGEADRERAAIDRERTALDRREATLRQRAEKERQRLRKELDEAEADMADRQRRYERDLAAYERASGR